MSTPSLMFLDVESSGLHPHLGHVPWEVAWKLAVVDGTTLRVTFADRIQIALTPHQIDSADDEALNIGGFYDRYDPDVALVPYAAAGRLSRFTPDGVRLAGSGVHFDKAMLEPLLRAHGREVLWDYRHVDVPDLAAGWLSARAGHGTWPLGSAMTIEDVVAAISALRAGTYRSSEVRRWAGVEAHAAHTAGGDVDWCLALYALVMGLDVDDPTEWP